MAEKEYLSTQEVKDILGLTVRRVVGLCNDGSLSGAIRNGRNWQIPYASVLAYMESHKKASAPGKDIPAFLPCAVGSTAYSDVSGNCYYVDKTLLIKDLLDSKNQVTLFTRPRRFGKTLVINMLKTFFEKSADDTSVCFQNRKIWQCGDKYKKEQGKYPVVHLTFKDARFNTWPDMTEALRLILRDEFGRHAELYSSDSLDDDDRRYLQGVQTGSLSSVEYARALLCLTRMLYKHYRQKVIILIDEYDTPLQQGCACGFYDDVFSFMRNFLSGGLKDNEALAFGVLTGVIHVSRENLLGGLNNLVVNTLMDSKYSEYFGFTEEEVCQMARYYGKTDKLPEIRQWYGGYLVGSTEIYNPWSVMNYFNNNCRPGAFWASTSDNRIIREIIEGVDNEITDNLIRLLKGHSVHTVLNPDVIYPDKTSGADSIFSFLMISGYLKPVSEPSETPFGSIAELKIPNTEISRICHTEILSWMKKVLPDNAQSALEKVICLRQTDRLQQTLHLYILSCIDTFDSAGGAFYHGMMLGLLVGMKPEYSIQSNHEIGDERFSVVLTPVSGQLPAVIMEFRSCSRGDKEKLAKYAKDAVNQINNRHYETSMGYRSYTRVIKYGIAFTDKNAEIVSEWEDRNEV